MKFLVIVLAVAMDRFSDLHQFFHHDTWYAAWRNAVSKWNQPAGVQLGVVLGLPVAAAALADWLLHGWWFGLPELVFSLAVLNPVECARVALLAAAQPDLATLGPVGFFLTHRMHDT